MPIKNRTLFHGDNLAMLRGLDSESIHLIATDPPFNKGRDFHATPDSLAAGASFQDRWTWDDDIKEWADQLLDDWPHVYYVIDGSRKSYGDDMGAFLCFMGVRLIEMWRVLRPDGSIYLHCDPTASHYLKELMDAVFDKKNFQNEIVWKRSAGQKGSQYESRKFGSEHDVILFYCKNAGKYTFNIPKKQIDLTEEERVRKFPKQDPDGRRWKDDSHHIWRTPGMGARENLCYTWRGFKNRSIAGWRMTKRKLEDEYQKGNIEIVEKSNGAKKLRRKVYEDDYAGENMGDLWTDIPNLTVGKEKVGYPTQKPVELYLRMIEASSNPDEMVLDPFCGCATTLVAAEKLRREWIGMDIWDEAHHVVIERLKNECFLEGPDNKRRDIIMSEGTITYRNVPPRRTDDAEVAVPYLKTKKKVQPPRGPKMSRDQMKEFLIEQHGRKCQGCYWKAHDGRHLQLDHNTPRSDGGANDIYNRVLLCGPCNMLKSNTYTLSGLRNENRKRGHMQGDASGDAGFDNIDVQAYLAKSGMHDNQTTFD